MFVRPVFFLRLTECGDGCCYVATIHDWTSLAVEEVQLSLIECVYRKSNVYVSY
jgi:hypothetical protein